MEVLFLCHGFAHCRLMDYVIRSRLRHRSKLVERQDCLITCNYFRGQIKFSDPTYFVPYFRHNFALTDYVTRLPETDGLLPLVSVRYHSCKWLLRYFPMEQPSLLQIVIGVRIRTPPLWYARTYAYLYLNIRLSHRCKRQSHRLKLFSKNSLSTDCYKYTTRLLLSQALFQHLLGLASP